MNAALIEKIKDRTAQIGIIGLGYVGLPLAVEFGKAGFHVIGFDIDNTKISTINSGQSYIPDVATKEVAQLVESEMLWATSDFYRLNSVDVAIICVPTPLKKTKDPDIQYILAACESIKKALHKGMLISLESSTYPGTTDELMLPMFEDAGFVVGVDFFLCFSPERVDPGNEKYHTHNIPKVVGGITPACTEVGCALYATAVNTVVPVQGTRTAEMVKLLENTFRMVNIGLVNELAMECDRMGINIWDVIQAASTKPFGYMRFVPGGVGGHCIPIDPFYFSWKAKQYGSESRLIETAGHINAEIPDYVVHKVQDALNGERKAINGSQILILGIAYKKNVDDTRESPAVDIAITLQKKGAIIKYHDPLVPTCNINGVTRKSSILLTSVQQADCVVVATDHDCVDYQQVYENSVLIVDCKNALSRIQCTPFDRSSHCVLYKYLREKADGSNWDAD
jgi:UDP-N-acetyl-D-glucosamine dehydrogenase